MRAEARHQLKQDRLSKATFEAAEKTVDWSAEHKPALIIATAALLILAGAVTAGWYYLTQQDEKASLEMSRAVRTMDTPVRPADMPPQPDNPSFASSKERATEARKQFQAIIEKYPHTRSADFARYFVGVTDGDLGDKAGSIRELQAVADSHSGDFSSLAKFALASAYRKQNRNKDAIAIYNALIQNPTATVGKVTAQMELGATFEADHQPLEAKRVYQQVQKENPSGPAAQLAAEKLQALK